MIETLRKEKVFCCGNEMETKRVIDPDTKKEVFVFVCIYCMTAISVENKKDLQEGGRAS